MLPEDCSDAWYPRGMDRAQRAQRLNCGSRIRGTQKCTGRSNEDHAFCCAQGVRILKPSLWSHKMHRSQHFRQIYIQSLPCFFSTFFSVFFFSLRQLGSLGIHCGWRHAKRMAFRVSEIIRAGDLKLRRRLSPEIFVAANLGKHLTTSDAIG